MLILNRANNWSGKVNKNRKAKYKQQKKQKLNIWNDGLEPWILFSRFFFLHLIENSFLSLQKEFLKKCFFPSILSFSYDEAFKQLDSLQLK